MCFRSVYACRPQLESTASVSVRLLSQKLLYCQRTVNLISQRAFVFGFTIWENDIILYLLFILLHRAHLASISSRSTTFPNHRFHLRRRVISFLLKLSHRRPPGSPGQRRWPRKRPRVPQVPRAAEDRRRAEP